METNLHHSSQFNEELGQLRNHVSQMGALIESQMLAVTKAYIKNDTKSAQKVLDNDKEVNAFEKAIDEECIQVIARRQPAASDLRLIMSVGKIVTDLERMGDETKKIAKCILNLHGRSPQVITDKAGVHHLALLASKQLQDALLTFEKLDVSMAADVIEADNELDAEFKSTVRQLITYMMEDARTISQALEIMTMARAFERIGDHSTNIAEQVIYIAEGRDVRHTS